MRIRSLFFVVSALDEIRDDTRRSRLRQKISELAARLEEMVRIETGRARKDDERIRAVLNAATGGSIERMLLSMNLTELDREFLRDKGCRF
jgi:hypothetical protein